MLKDKEKIDASNLDPQFPGVFQDFKYEMKDYLLLLLQTPKSWQQLMCQCRISCLLFAFEGVSITTVKSALLDKISYHKLILNQRLRSVLGL